MKYLVTGCAGFIGSHLVERLTGEGHAVTGIDCFLPLLYSRAEKERNLNEIRQKSNFRFHEFDLRQEIPEKLLIGIDLIINLAALPGLAPSWTNMKDYFDCNSLVVGNICEASQKFGGIPVLQASTSSVYGINATSSEDGALRPISPYGVSKLSAEQLLIAFYENFGVPFTILRYFSVYGPRQRPDMAYRKIINAILEGQPIDIHGDGLQTRSNTYVEDIVEATVTSSKKSFQGDIFNIGGSQSIQLLEAIRLIESIIGNTVKKQFHPSRAGDQAQTAANYRKAQKAINFFPKIEFQDGLTRQIEWQRRNQILN